MESPQSWPLLLSLRNLLAAPGPSGTASPPGWHRRMLPPGRGQLDPCPLGPSWQWPGLVLVCEREYVCLCARALDSGYVGVDLKVPIRRWELCASPGTCDLALNCPGVRSMGRTGRFQKNVLGRFGNSLGHDLLFMWTWIGMFTRCPLIGHSLVGDQPCRVPTRPLGRIQKAASCPELIELQLLCSTSKPCPVGVKVGSSEVQECLQSIT